MTYVHFNIVLPIEYSPLEILINICSHAVVPHDPAWKNVDICRRTSNTIHDHESDNDIFGLGYEMVNVCN